MRYDDEDDDRNRGEYSGGPTFGGPYAREGGWSGGGSRDDYARDRGWSGGGARDDYARDADHRYDGGDVRWGGTGARGDAFGGGMGRGQASVGYGPAQTRSTYGDQYGGSAETYGAVDPLASHRGKGPKNYKRSDARIEEEVNEALTDDHHVDATDIVVSVANGEVTLTGVVNSREMKRRAEQIAEHCSGVRDVFNNLRVQNDREFQIGKARE